MSRLFTYHWEGQCSGHAAAAVVVRWVRRSENPGREGDTFHWQAIRVEKSRALDLDIEQAVLSGVLGPRRTPWAGDVAQGALPEHQWLRHASSRCASRTWFISQRPRQDPPGEF